MLRLQAMNPPRVLFIGRSTLDALYRLDHLPAEDTKIYAEDFHAAPGGPALNAALTHALLGGKSMLVSAVGGGPWAAQVRAELDRHQIALLDPAAGTEYETPLTTVLIGANHSSRTIINPPLSTVQLPHWSGSWEQSVPAEWGSVPPVVLTDGFHIAETLPLLTACKVAGAALCLDGGSWKPGTAELAPLLTAAICSERFAVPGLDGTPESLFAWFASQGVPSVALTRGPRSILGWQRGCRFEIEIAPIDAVDTLGAGDVLHGAFCHHFALKPDFESALRRASEIATLSCQNFGIQVVLKAVSIPG
jgi:sugar/nucleoside kinase (ribokinase family)